MSWREPRAERGKTNKPIKIIFPPPLPPTTNNTTKGKSMMNTLVASSSQMVAVPRLRATGARSSARVSAVRPPMMAVTHAKGKKFSVVAQALGNNNNDDSEKQQQQKRGSKASALSASRNPQAAAASSAIEVIPGDYRIGGVLLSVAAFLGPVCHLWTQFGVHGILARESLAHLLLTLPYPTSFHFHSLVHQRIRK